MGATSMTKPYVVLLLACLVLLGACSRDETPAAQAPANESADTALGRTPGKVAEKVRTKLEHENITLSSSDAEAKAEITPTGALFISMEERRVGHEGVSTYESRWLPVSSKKN